MRLGLCVEMVFAGLPFEQRLAKAAELGFDDVEMWFVDGSFKGSAVDLASVAMKHGVTITNTVIGSPDGSVGGGLTNPANRGKWLERAKTVIEFTEDAGIPATIVCTGNTVQGMSDEQMTESVVEGLKPTVELAERNGITLLLEPLNTSHDHKGYFLTSSDKGAEICRRIGSKRMRLLFDCYHMQIMEGDLMAHIKRNIDVIGHFHAAGVPGRHELYEGEVNYPFILRELQEMNYEGVFGLEYAPSIDDEESLEQTLTYLIGE